MPTQQYVDYIQDRTSAQYLRNQMAIAKTTGRKHNNEFKPLTAPKFEEDLRSERSTSIWAMYGIDARGNHRPSRKDNWEAAGYFAVVIIIGIVIYNCCR